MIKLFHISAIFFGVLAYYYSDVNSQSGFYNTFLPFIVLVCFIYGLVVTISMLYHLRVRPQRNDKSTDLLLSSLREHGLLDKSTEILQPTNSRLEVDAVVEQTNDTTVIQSYHEVTETINNHPDEFEAENTQKLINQQQWDNPANWSGSGLWSIYFSKDDSRTLIPHRIRWLGFTLNMAKNVAVYSLVIKWVVSTIVAIFLFEIFYH